MLLFELSIFEVNLNFKSSEKLISTRLQQKITIVNKKVFTFSI